MQQIHWPAILQFDQDDELMYLADYQDWLSFICANQFTVCLQDKLIDTAGYIYHIETAKQVDASNINVTQRPYLVKQEQLMNLVQLLPIVRQFGQFQGHCCSAKIIFTTVEQGIATVAELEQLY
jgi:hypothetical protein